MAPGSNRTPQENSAMSERDVKKASCRQWLSPLRLSLLAINAVCFGACLVLLAIGTASGPLVLLTIGTGLSLGAGLAGALVAAHSLRSHHEKT